MRPNGTLARESLLAPIRAAALCLALAWAGLGGCSGISIEPTCPAELQVGDSGPVAANAIEPGQIPTYLWEVFPPDSGTFVDPSAPSTTFQALLEGEAIISLTAGDGLYQVISECRTLVSGSLELIVLLEATPNSVAVGETVTLTCSSLGEEAATLSILQVDGLVVELMDDIEGVATFEAQEPGDRIFQCTGRDVDGVLEGSVLATVHVNPSPDDTANDNDNAVDDDTQNTGDNVNENDNEGDSENDNEGDNEDDDDGRIPPRPPL